MGVLIANQLTDQQISILSPETESPFGLTQEIKLARDNLCVDHDSVSEDGFPTYAIDWNSEGSSGESETSEDRAIADDIKRKNVWSAFASLQSQCVDSIKCVKGYKIYRDYLHAAHGEIMALAQQDVGSPGQRDGAMASFPAVSKHSQSNRRTKRLSSPKKRRKASSRKTKKY